MNDEGDNVSDVSDNNDDNGADNTKGVSHFVSHYTVLISSLFHNFSLMINPLPIKDVMTEMVFS